MYFFIWEALSNHSTAIVAERHFPKNPQLHINDNTYLSVSVVARAKISYYMCDHDFPWQISIGAIWKCCLCDKSWCNLHVPVRTGHLKLDKRLNMSHLFSHRHKSAIFIISLTADFCSSIHMHSVKQLTSDEGKTGDMQGREKIGAPGFAIFRPSCSQVETCQGLTWQHSEMVTSLIHYPQIINHRP